MKAETTLHHVALQCSDKEKAEIFFAKILGLAKVKDFTLTDDLSDSIFGIHNSVEIKVYEDGTTRFEVFIDSTGKKTGYEHTCIEVENMKELISRCNKHGIEPVLIKKEGKDLLFIRDFSDNLFEVKEKQKP
jgi:catechol 2,3-dioxygenase-like lactoylglutathione lyase family enzyme